MEAMVVLGEEGEIVIADCFPVICGHVVVVVHGTHAGGFAQLWLVCVFGE